MGLRAADGRSTAACRTRDERTNGSVRLAGHMQKLSVIIPFYNEAATLQKIVELVLAVPLVESAKQLILVDDGSSDGSADVAKRLADQHPDAVRYIAMCANRGKGAAVRRGLQEV